MCLREKNKPLIELNVQTQGSTILPDTWIRYGSTVYNSTILENVFVGFRVQIYNSEIGDGCQIASRAIIGAIGARSVNIEPYTWIGAQAIIKPGIKIGKGAVIGAGAIVENDIPPFSIVVGRPGKIIRYRENIFNDGGTNFSSLLSSTKKRLLKNDQFVRNFMELLELNMFEFPNTFCSYIEKLSNDKNFIFGNNCFLDATINCNGKVLFKNSVIAIGKKIEDQDGNLILDGGINIGGNVEIGSNTILEGGGKIAIGSNCKIGNYVHILSTSHDYQYLSLPMKKLPVVIHNNVVIGDNALILGGVTIEEGAVIWPNSIVTKDVKAFQVHKGTILKEENVSENSISS